MALSQILDVSTGETRYVEAPDQNIPVPEAVTMRQARLALHGIGLLASVEAAVTAQGEAAQIEWDYAQEVRKDHPLLQSLKGTVGITDADIDTLFVLAATL